MLRYQQLLDVVYQNKCKRIIEIGTHNGNTAKLLIKAASLANPRCVVEYIGYDLFEDLTEEDSKNEFNGKEPPRPLLDVYADLEKFCSDNGVYSWNIDLRKGYTKDTFWREDFLIDYDICFIDGGHSLDTIRGDIEKAIKCSKIVVVDDYYFNRDDVGCKKVLTERREPFFIMPLTDIINNLNIAMAVTPVEAYPWTRYCAIFGHIKENKPKKVALVANDKILINHMLILAKMFEFDMVEDPLEHEDLDLAILQFKRDEDQDAAREIYNLVRHAKAIIIDGVEGDAVSGFRGLPLDLFEEDKRTPIFPPSADGITVALWPQGLANVNLQVKTRNCVEDEVIAENVRVNTPRIDKWVVPCKPHNATAICVSAGSSLYKKETLDSIQNIISSSNEYCYVVCVKHAHDYLISNGIIPDFCILLDPRNHVKNFIDNPHPDTTYLVASMCHPDTLTKLLDNNANIIGYNARVSASLDTFKEVNPINSIVAIPGGSAASTRGIALLHCLGFRNFECFAYDLTLNKMPEKTEKTFQGFDKVVQVEVDGERYWTDLELIAQANDISYLYETIDKCILNDWSKVNLNFHGNAMGQHVASNYVKGEFNYTLQDVLKGINVRTISTPRTKKLNYKVIS